MGDATQALKTLARRAALGLLSFGAGCGPGEALAPSQAKPIPGMVTTAVGTGTQGFDGDGHAPLKTWLNQPTELAFDPSGQLEIVDWNNHRIRRLSASGSFETIVGAELPGDWPLDVPLDETVVGTALHVNHPLDLAFSAGETFIAAWHNHKIERLDANGAVHVVAGANRPGYAGDGGAAQAALLNFPASLVVQTDGGMLVADERNNVVRRLAPDESRTMSTVAGVKGKPAYAGDGGPAAEAALGLSPAAEVDGSDNPPPGGGLALAEDGTLYVADTFNHCVRRITPGADGLLGVGDASEETIETFAGSCGQAGYDPSATAGDALLLRDPSDLELYAGALYIADTGNHVVWRVELETSQATLWVGNGQPGSRPEPSAPLETQLNRPYGIGFDAAGNLYIADTMNNRIRVLWQ